MKSKSLAYSISLLLLSSAACDEVELPSREGDPGRAPVVRSANAPPIFGGTLLVTRNGSHAIVADPPRDMIHIVDLHRWEEVGTLELEAGALPFRAVEDDAGQVHVTLRGTGELVTLNPSAVEIVRTTEVCPNPRGVGFDNDTHNVHVACAGGMFVTLPAAGGELSRRFLPPDLRDVFVSDGRVFVSRFRPAEVLEVLDEGWELIGAPISLVTGPLSHEPSTAWRTMAHPNGSWLMLHQLASSKLVPGFEEPGQGDEFPGDGGYGGFGSCDAVVNTTVSAAMESGQVVHAGVIGGFALAVDAAVSPDGKRVAVASPSQQDHTDDFFRTSVFELELTWMQVDPNTDCNSPAQTLFEGDVVAVDYQPDGPLLALTRNEPVLYRIHDGEVEKLKLTGTDATHTGFDLFHNDAGSGISCASCHPEGTEDGRTWVFENLGPRRTQPLNIGLEGTAPFHWKGDMDDIHMIARQVRQGAMGGTEQSAERQEALQDWLFSIRPPNPLRPSSDGDANKGKQLFESMNCDGCHAGPSFTSPASADLGHGLLQTPGLRGVALRAPYMHDGRATTLADAVVDMASTTPGGRTLDEDEVASVVAYLESL